ncbi:MAG: hypothetical protein HZC24_03030 [Rhodocyclales bacterium]|nr:hypothetical protein [Rhodocyclales bacterium]
MNHKAWRWLAAIVASLATLPLYAQHRRAPERDFGRDVSRSQFPPQYRPGGEMTPRPPSESPQAVRMSPEERRQLRRDIDDAGRELYRRDKPRFQP